MYRTARVTSANSPMCLRRRASSGMPPRGHTAAFLLMLMCAPHGVASGEEAPDDSARRVARLAQVAFQAAIERHNALSFQYRYMPRIGPLPSAKAEAAFGRVFGNPPSARPVSPWSEEKWHETVSRTMTEWGDTRSVAASELVRTVVRHGDAYQDADCALVAAHRVERPTAFAAYCSRSLNFEWTPLTRRIVLTAGDLRRNQRPNGRYFFRPTALMSKGLHFICDVSVLKLASGREIVMRDARSSPPILYKYYVHESLGWLPTRSLVLHGRDTLESASYEWSHQPGVGWFPAAIARMTQEDGLAVLSLASFSDPMYAAAPPSRWAIPAGTTLVDTRTRPATITALASESDLAGDWQVMTKLGPALTIPPELLRPPAPRAPRAGPGPGHGRR